MRAWLPLHVCAVVLGGVFLVGCGDGDGGGNGGTPGDTTPPGDVLDLTAVHGDQSVQLTWWNPWDSDFEGVMVRRATGAPPADNSSS